MSKTYEEVQKILDEVLGETEEKNRFLKMCPCCSKPLYQNDVRIEGTTDWGAYSLFFFTCNSCRSTATLKVKGRVTA